MNPNKLAIDGGARVTRRPLPKLVRWGAPELRQLATIRKQLSLFYWNGPQTKLLRERFQKHYPFKHVMPCSSGTAALHIAVAAAGLGPGDEIIISPITDMGSVIGILFQQAVPVFADVEPYSCNLDVADVRRKITSKTKAIMAVHLVGNPCDMDGLRQLAAKHKLTIIEDCAQAWGARYQGKPVGTLGEIGCYSLNDFKHIGCGDGGIVATNNDRIGPLLQRFGDKAFDRSGGSKESPLLGLNYRMSELCAAFASVQLTRMAGIAAKRERLGKLLTTKLQDIAGIHPQAVRPDDFCSYMHYFFRLDLTALRVDRDAFVRALCAEGVPASGGVSLVYRVPVFQNHSFFAGRWPIKEFGLTDMDYSKVRCPEAEAMAATRINLPLHQGLDEQWIASAARAVQKIARHYRKG